MAERRKCFTILGLEQGATEDDIKKAYKKLALQFHPDKNNSEDAKSKFQEIGYAYKYLTEGPTTFQTSDPHDLREEFLRRLFEDLFFPRFHHHQQHYFGGFPFFFADDDDDDDECYYFSSDSSDEYGYTGHHFQRFHVPTGGGAHPRQPATSYHQPSAKQQQKKEKRKRHRERAKENRRHQKEEEKKKTEQVYTNDINEECNTSTKPQDTEEPDKNDSNNNAVPSKTVPASKMNKKERKKQESEQRKRDKEMEEIAAELMRKQEQDLERQKEKERQAAKKKAEERENMSDLPHFYAQKEKKSRKAKQREKRRQEASANTISTPGSNSGLPETQPIINPRPSSACSAPSETHQGVKHRPASASTSTGYSSNSAMKTKQDRTRKKSGITGSRFDVLDDLSDSEDSHPGTPELSGNGSKTERDSASKPQHQSAKNSDSHFMSRPNSRNSDSGNEKTSNKQNNSSLFKKAVNQACGHKSGTVNSSYHENTGSNSSGKFGSNYSEINQDTLSKTCGVIGVGVGASNNRQNKHKDIVDDDEDTDDNDDDTDDDVHGAGSEMPPNISTGYDRSKNSVNNQNPSQRKHGYQPNNNPYVNGYTGHGNVRGRGNTGYKEFIPRTRGGYSRPQYPPRFDGPNSYGNHGFRGPPPQRFDGQNHYGNQGFRGPPPFPSRFNGPDYHQGFRGPPPPMQGSYPPRSPYYNGYNGMPPQQGNYRGGYPGHPQYWNHHTYSDNATTQRPRSPPQKLHKGHITVPDDKNKNVGKSDLPSKSGRSSHDLHSSKLNKTQNSENVQTAAKLKDVKHAHIGAQYRVQRSDSSSNKNMFSTKVFNNQACSRETLDLLDDIEDIPNGIQGNETSEADLLSGLASSSSDIDTGIDAFLSRDKLGVPKGLINDNIKNYYK